jgi:hypothetical protein
MEPIAFWKSLGGKAVPAEADIKAFLALDDAQLAVSLLKSVQMPADVAETPQILKGLEWSLPREFARVRKSIENPAVVVAEATEGFDDMAMDEPEMTYAERAVQELTIFRGMISQRLKMLSSGAIDELRPALEKR